jgi:serine/threonine-protein kinase RsbW
MQSLTLPGTLDALKPIRDYASDAAKSVGLPESAAYNLCLAVDEIATNVVTHGYEEVGISGNLTIGARVDCGQLIVELRDQGKSYDPSKHHIPTAEDLSLPLEERGIGGLGILLAFVLSLDLTFCALLETPAVT